MILNQARKMALDSLAAFYSPGECTAIVRRLLEEKFGAKPTDVILRGDILEIDGDEFYNCIVRLQNFEPIQYIVGFEEFCGLRFSLSKATLIPRPETQQLVELIISRVDAKQNIRILDIGTGSGAIAVSLAYLLPQAQVVAMDISSEALNVAALNATDNGVNVSVINADILTFTSTEKFDIIVSNPPYVTQSESRLMLPNVLNHEPHTALFVPDDAPLIFYKAIAKFASTNLNFGGQLFFEINEQFSYETCDVLQNYNFCDIQSYNDLNDKPRIVCARN